jgi:hypothetical protein
MAHHRSKAWLSQWLPFKQGFEYPLDAGEEKMFDFRKSPPLPNLLVRPNYGVRLVALLERVLS